MVGFWIIVVICSLLAAATGTLIALRIQYRMLEEGHQERVAWREAQEARQRTWEVRQAKRNLEVEKQLSSQVKDIYREWQGWQQDWRDQTLQEQQNMQTRADLEQQLARLPHIEDIELPLDAHSPRQQPARWQPPALYQADLRGRDLSHRYMGCADLREAQLAGTNLYLADLTGAIMTNANLAGANLAGANLRGADLRGADLRGTNLLVADLHHAILHGATLLETRGLSWQQLQTALYDTTTIIDKSVLITPSPTPDVLTTPAEPLHTAYETQPITTPQEPGDNEVTLRMPALSKAARQEIPSAETEVALESKQAEKRPEAEHPCGSEALTSTERATSENGLPAMPHSDNSLDPAPAEETSEASPSGKIIQLQTRSSKADPLTATKQTGSKKKGGSQINKISSIAKSKDKQSRAN